MCVRCVKSGKKIVGGVISSDAIQSEKYGRQILQADRKAVDGIARVLHSLQTNKWGPG